MLLALSIGGGLIAWERTYTHFNGAAEWRPWLNAPDEAPATAERVRFLTETHERRGWLWAAPAAAATLLTVVALATLVLIRPVPRWVLDGLRKRGGRRVRLPIPLRKLTWFERRRSSRSA